MAATTFTKNGYGQVEPNHLSAQRTSQIYAQLPANSSIDVLENGQYVKYDYANNEVNYTADDGEWMMVFNEVKLYDDWRESYKDFAMKKENYTPGSTTVEQAGIGPFPGQMVPRVIKTNVGDIYTTNAIQDDDYSVGDTLTPEKGTTGKGFLKKVGASETPDMVWKIVKIYSLADGEPAVKLMRIK